MAWCAERDNSVQRELADKGAVRGSCLARGARVRQQGQWCWRGARRCTLLSLHHHILLLIILQLNATEIICA